MSSLHVQALGDPMVHKWIATALSGASAAQSVGILAWELVPVIIKLANGASLSSFSVGEITTRVTSAIYYGVNIPVSLMLVVMSAMLDVNSIRSANTFLIGSLFAGTYATVGWIALIFIPYIVGFFLDQSYFTNRSTIDNIADLSFKAISPVVSYIAAFDSMMVALDTAF